MINTKEEYLKYKKIESMIFGNINYDYLNELCNQNDVIFFRKVIIYMLMQYYISKNELNNVYIILDYFQKNNIDSNAINSILYLLKRDFIDDLYFYRREMFIRTKKFKYLNKISDNEILNMRDEINKYINNDILLLNKLSNRNESLNNFTKDELIYSIRSYLHEYPKLLSDDYEYNTIMNIISNFDGNDVKKIKNKINNQIKKLK